MGEGGRERERERLKSVCSDVCVCVCVCVCGAMPGCVCGPYVLSPIMTAPPPLEGFAAFAAAAGLLDSDDEQTPPTDEVAAGKTPDSNTKHLPPTLDDFELLRLVGAGGFGKVYQVK